MRLEAEMRYGRFVPVLRIFRQCPGTFVLSWTISDSWRVSLLC